MLLLVISCARVLLLYTKVKRLVQVYSEFTNSFVARNF